jgi:amino acid transporter
VSISEVHLSRDLGLFSATMIGVGAMIGAGIFVLTGIAAGIAGPGLILAFLLNGIITMFTALAYAELGSAIPVAGGGYAWIKEALPQTAFISGWMDWFAHSVAGSLYALGFGAYFGWLLTEAGVLPGGILMQKLFAVILILIFIYINYRGVSQIGRAENAVTLVKIAVLLIFAVSGLVVMAKNPGWIENFQPFLPKGIGSLFISMGLIFIAFEGYEIIVQAGEEVKNPKKNIPRAVLLSVSIVLPIYLLVGITALGAFPGSWEFLGQKGELGLIEAARKFVPFGTFILLVGGLASTMSALNATTFSSTRVSFAMGRDFSLPSAFRRIHPKNKTPHFALLFSGGMILFMAVALPIQDVACAASVMFLLLFLQVNIAVIKIRKKMGEKLDYGYKMPLFPFIPLLGIASLTFLAFYIFFYSPIAWYATLLWIGIGIVVYFGYAATKEEVEKAKISVEIPKEYRIVVSLANPEDVDPLMKIACSIAKIRESEVVAVHIIDMPYQTFLHVGKHWVDERLPLLDKAGKIGERYGVKVRKRIIISHDVPRAIIDFAESGKSNLIILGWTGRIFKSKARISVQHRVMTNAPCEVAVLKPKDFRDIKRILLPLGKGEHSARVRIADGIASVFGAKILLLNVIPTGKNEKTRQKVLEIQEMAEKICRADVEKEIVEAPVVEDVLIERSKDFDLLIMGPSEEWILKDFLLGSMPDKVANEANCSVLMVTEPEVRAESWLHLIWKRIVEFFSKR